MSKPVGFFTRDDKVRPITRRQPHIRTLQKGTASLTIPKRTFHHVHRLPCNTKHNPKHLAEINVDGSVWVNPSVPEEYEGIKVRQRVYIYEDAVRRERSHGKSEMEAKQIALEESHRGLSPEQVNIMEGKLGSISKHGRLSDLSIPKRTINNLRQKHGEKA